MWIALLSTASASAQPVPTPPDPPALRVGGVTISGYVQADGIFATGDRGDQTRDTFRLRRVRLALRGALMPAIEWTVTAELTGTPALRDVHVTFEHLSAVNVRVGQFVMPFSLERLTSTTRLEAIDRTVVSDRLTPSRDAGIMVFNARPFLKCLWYAAAVANGTGANVRDTNDAKDVMGRLAIQVPGVAGVSVGMNGASGRQPEGTRGRVGTDLNIERPAFRVAAEIIRETWDAAPGIQRTGLHVLGVWRVKPAHPRGQFLMAELVGRFTNVNDNTRDVETRQIELGANYHATHHLKLMTTVIVPVGRASLLPDATFIGRLQWMF